MTRMIPVFWATAADEYFVGDSAVEGVPLAEFEATNAGATSVPDQAGVRDRAHRAALPETAIARTDRTFFRHPMTGRARKEGPPSDACSGDRPWP